MKIGTSLSRCVRDIYKGVVDFNDVMVIVTRTDFDPENDRHWSSIWHGYASGGLRSAPEWIGYQDKEQEFRDICIRLKKTGKLHQPRQFGAHPVRMQHYWYDIVLTPDNLLENPAAHDAWNTYITVAKLSGIS